MAIYFVKFSLHGDVYQYVCVCFLVGWDWCCCVGYTNGRRELCDQPGLGLLRTLAVDRRLWGWNCTTVWQTTSSIRVVRNTFYTWNDWFCENFSNLNNENTWYMCMDLHKNEGYFISFKRHNFKHLLYT